MRKWLMGPAVGALALLGCASHKANAPVSSNDTGSYAPSSGMSAPESSASASSTVNEEPLGTLPSGAGSVSSSDEHTRPSAADVSSPTAAEESEAIGGAGTAGTATTPTEMKHEAAANAEATDKGDMPKADAAKSESSTTTTTTKTTKHHKKGEKAKDGSATGGSASLEDSHGSSSAGIGGSGLNDREAQLECVRKAQQALDSGDVAKAKKELSRLESKLSEQK